MRSSPWRARPSFTTGFSKRPTQSVRPGSKARTSGSIRFSLRARRRLRASAAARRRQSPCGCRTPVTRRLQAVLDRWGKALRGRPLRAPLALLLKPVLARETAVRVRGKRGRPAPRRPPAMLARETVVRVALELVQGKPGPAPRHSLRTALAQARRRLRQLATPTASVRRRRAVAVRVLHLMAQRPPPPGAAAHRPTRPRQRSVRRLRMRLIRPLLLRPLLVVRVLAPPRQQVVRRPGRGSQRPRRRLRVSQRHLVVGPLLRRRPPLALLRCRVRRRR